MSKDVDRQVEELLARRKVLRTDEWNEYRAKRWARHDRVTKIIQVFAWGMVVLLVVLVVLAVLTGFGIIA